MIKIITGDHFQGRQIERRLFNLSNLLEQFFFSATGRHIMMLFRHGIGMLCTGDHQKIAA